MPLAESKKKIMLP